MQTIIDGDVVAYRAAFIGANNGMDLDEVITIALDLTHQWAEEAGCEWQADILMCLSPKRTFRHDLAPTYKAHRKARAKPPWLSEVRTFLGRYFESRTDPNIEADDTMGIVQSGSEDDSIIVTVDKDLLQIPGKMYNPVKQTFHETTPEQGWDLFLTQWLTGDSVDGYPGLKGIGPKKAEKILADADDPVRTIVDLYEEKGCDWEFCCQQAQFAMILTSDRWDDDSKVPLLWEPPPYESD